jgi:hypothetical protein
LQSNEFKIDFGGVEVGCRFKIAFESGANQITGEHCCETELYSSGLQNLEQIKSF